MIKNFFKILLVFCFLLFTNNEVFADKPAMPYSYQNVVGNGKYIFVMLAEHSKPLTSSSGKQYLSSGLYMNDGSNNPTWTVEWFAFTVYVSSDGKHLVRMGPWPSLKNGREPDVQELAVAFYENGGLLKQYTISDLINNPKNLPQSVSHFEWKNDVLFDDVLSRLTIITTEDNKYVFDVNSGEVITGVAPATNSTPEKTKENIIIRLLTPLAALGAIIGVAIIVVKLRSRQRKT